MVQPTISCLSSNTRLTAKMVSDRQGRPALLLLLCVVNPLPSSARAAAHSFDISFARSVAATTASMNAARTPACEATVVRAISQATLPPHVTTWRDRRTLPPLVRRILTHLLEGVDARDGRAPRRRHLILELAGVLCRNRQNSW